MTLHRTQTRVRVPAFRQRTHTDCGLTCLQMVLALHGRPRRRTDLEAWLPGGRDGQSALALLEAARSEGLTAQGVKLSADALPDLTPGSILHMRPNHFVVFEGVLQRGSRRFAIVDPAKGRVQLDAATLAGHFSGIALTLTPGPGFVRCTRPASPLARYVRALLVRRLPLLNVLALSLGLTALALALPWSTRWVVDHLAHTPVQLSLRTLAQLALLVALGQALLTVARGLVLTRMRAQLEHTLVDDLLTQLLRLPYSFFQQRSVGDLVMRVTSTARIREAVTEGAVSAAVDGLLVLLYLGLLWFASPRLFLGAIVLCLLHLGLFAWHRPRTRRLFDAYVAAESEVRGYQTRLLVGIETIKATGGESDVQRHFANLHADVLAAARAQGRFSALTDGLGAALRTLSPLGLLLIGAREVMVGQLTLGTMLGAAQLCLAFLTPVTALIATAANLQLALSHAERLEDVHEARPEESGTKQRTLQGGIALREVSFAYNRLAGDVIRELNLTIAPGEHVAIVGPSGSGKSTLARILLGLLPTERGSVEFDGQALAELDLMAFRRQIGVVPQEVRLLDLTVADNIRLGVPDASQAEIERAARSARIHDEICALPLGYRTRLADGGSNFSGGQRQRIALARALLRNPRILLLDEATSALDTVSEAAIQEVLDARPCTVITIAHRISTVRRADRIIVLNAGRIVEQGEHEALVQYDGNYRRLVAAQLDA